MVFRLGTDAVSQIFNFEICFETNLMNQGYPTASEPPVPEFNLGTSTNEYVGLDAFEASEG